MFSHRASSLSALNHNHILPLAGSQHLPFAICEAVSVQIDNEEHGSRKRRQHNVEGISPVMRLTACKPAVAGAGTWT